MPRDPNNQMTKALAVLRRNGLARLSEFRRAGITAATISRLAIGPKDWRPRLKYPPMRFAHFSIKQQRAAIEHHSIEGVSVPIFSITKTIADLFRYRRIVGINVAIEGLREAMRQQKATPGDIARRATDGGVWKVMEPYVSALTNG